MKLKHVTTRQFAGIRGVDIGFGDGMNLLIGDNEAGKSTIIELIYQTLYRKSALSRRDDKDFYARFFPSDQEGAFVDGKLTFDTEEGEYTLEKRWGKSPRCELYTPQGAIIEDEDIIRTKLGALLQYQRGLYDDVVFSSQRRQAEVVEHILKDLDEKRRAGDKETAKSDLVSILSAEGMQSAGGIAPVDLEKAIAARLSEYTGHWDFEADGPQGRRGIERPWQKEVGKILEAFYALSYCRSDLEEARIAEEAIDRDHEKIKSARESLKRHRQAQEEYNRYAKVLAAYQQSGALKREYQKQKDLCEKDQEAYPELLRRLMEAEDLRKLSEAAGAIKAYRACLAKREALEEAQQQMADCRPIPEEDESRALSLRRQIDRLSSRLSGIDVSAKVEQLGDAPVEIRSLVTGETLALSEGGLRIQESVEVSVPGVMRMTLSPQGVDAAKVQAEIEDCEAEYRRILAAYEAADLAQLSEKKRQFDTLSQKKQLRQSEYEGVLAGRRWEDIEEAYRKVRDLEPRTAGVEERIRALCGRTEVGAFVQQQKTLLEAIEQRYAGGPDDISESIQQEIFELDGKIREQEAIMAQSQEIPESIRQIRDTQAYERRLEDSIAAATEQLDAARDALAEDEKRLGDASVEDLQQKVEEAEETLAQRKQECARWTHILQVLRATQESFTDTTAMTDVQERFAEYLSVITEGTLQLDSMNEKMDLRLSSNARPLTYELLSEGTKDTIAIAFRLAMLEHLFPEGGGLAVMDDPFTDMDEKRTRQACQLLQRFAEHGNQVLFVTCDGKYESLLEGKVIPCVLT